MSQFANMIPANFFLDALLPFFSSQYLLVPSLVILTALLYVGTTSLRSCVLRVFLALLLAGLASGIAGSAAGTPPPFMSGLGRAFINNTWQSPDSGVPVPLEPLRPLPYGECLAAILLLGFARVRRWTLWLTIPLNACALLAPVYCGWCWPGVSLAAWAIGALSFLGVQFLPGGGRFAGFPPSDPLLRELPRERLIFALLLVVWTTLSFVGLYLGDYMQYGIQPDEGKYWYWSRRLQLCYYSKPPMIALIDRFLSGVLGNTASALRTGGILLYAAVFLPVYALTKRITGREGAALMAVVLLAAMPAFVITARNMDTNKPAHLLWATALYTSHRAFHGERRMWAITGLVIGLGLLTRYTFPFLAVALALTVIIFHRGRLKEWGPYVAFLCSLMCILGLLYWQYEHHWVTLEDIGSDAGGLDWKVNDGRTTVPGFLYEQMMAVSPVIFLLFLLSMGAMAAKSAKNPDAGMLLIAFLVLFVPFLAMSYGRHVSGHWVYCAYLAAAPAAAWVVTEGRSRKLTRVLVTFGIILGLAEGVIFSILFFFPAKRQIPPQEVAQVLQSHCDSTAANAPFILVPEHSMGAGISLYTPGHPDIPCCGGTFVCGDTCAWTDWGALAGKDALFVFSPGLLPGGSAKDTIDRMVSSGAFRDGELLDCIKSKALNKELYVVRLRAFSGQDMCGNF